MTNWYADTVLHAELTQHHMHSEDVIFNLILVYIIVQIQLNIIPNKNQIGSHRCLAPDKWQAIISTKHYMVWWCIFVSLGIKELNIVLQEINHTYGIA